MTDNHDDRCEAEFIYGPMLYSPCDCTQRAAARAQGVPSDPVPIEAAQGLEPIDGCPWMVDGVCRDSQLVTCATCPYLDGLPE